MQNLSLRTKLILAFAIPISLLLIVEVVGIITVNNVQGYFLDVSETSLPLIKALEEIRFAGLLLNSSTNEFVVDNLLGLEANEEGEEGEGDELAEIEAATEIYYSALDTYRTLAADAAQDDLEDAELFEAVETAGQGILDASDAILSLVENDAEPSELAESREALEGAETNYEAAIDEALAEGSS